MSWLAVALTAYLILAVVNLLDKFLVDNVMKSSRAYAFAACVLGAGIALVSPWFLTWPGWLPFFHNLINGFIFAAALWSLFSALRRGEVSRILVLVGGLTPVFTLILSLLFLEESFSRGEIMGMLLILVGVFLIIFLPFSKDLKSKVGSVPNLKLAAFFQGMAIAALSALFYSVYFISTKEAYLGQPFFSAFIWTRLGAALAVMLFLLRSADRLAIKEAFLSSDRGGKKFLVVFNQSMGAAGFILQNYAVYLGSVVIVNALQGVQYAFLLVISGAVSLLAPQLLKEDFSRRAVFQKSLAVAAIMAGLYFIASL